MKKLTALLLVMCLLLCGCGKASDVAEAATEAPTEAPTEATVEATEAPTEEPTEAPTEPPVLYRHPLTGEPLDSVFTSRVIASTVNNVPAALPQYGILHADVIYEIETEGAATRLLALFTDLSEVGPLGSVRSARTYFSSIMRSYDGVLTHVGASDEANRSQHDPYGNRLTDWAHIDWGIHAKYSYRDQDRRNAGYAYEHTLFTSGENILAALSDLGFETTKEEGYDFGLTFSEEPNLVGEPASVIAVYFDGGKDSTMTYNEETGLYEASQYGEPWIDAGNDDAVLTFRNILILEAARTRPYGYNSFYYLEGEGDGYFACDGQIVKIKWHRETVEDPFSYTLEDGTPITLGVGKSYIGITTPNCEPVYS